MILKSELARMEAIWRQQCDAKCRKATFVSQMPGGIISIKIFEKLKR